MLNNVKIGEHLRQPRQPRNLGGRDRAQGDDDEAASALTLQDSVNSFPVGGDLIITNNVADCEYRMLNEERDTVWLVWKLAHVLRFNCLI